MQCTQQHQRKGIQFYCLLDEMGKYSGGLILKYIFVKNAITSGLRFSDGVIYGYTLIFHMKEELINNKTRKILRIQGGICLFGN